MTFDPERRRTQREAILAKMRLQQLISEGADPEALQRQAEIAERLVGEAEQERLAQREAASLSQLRADQAERDEPPPFLKTWGRVYTMVVIYLGLVISAMYGVTRAFAP